MCGGRDYNNKAAIFNYLDMLFNPTNDLMPTIWGTIIAGGANGADHLAIEWAIANWMPWEEYPADWERYGKKAGYLRNKQMLEEGKPDFVVAFPGGRGTANMVQLAEAAGVNVNKIGWS